MNGDQTGHPSIFVNTTGFHYYFNYLVTEMPSELSYFDNYVQLPNVRKAIHVGPMKWNTGDEVIGLSVSLFHFHIRAKKTCLTCKNNWNLILVSRWKSILSMTLCNRSNHGLKSWWNTISKVIILCFSPLILNT